MTDKDNNKAPFFRNWNGWYAAVILVLVTLIILFYFFTKHYS
jgi:hypothetical protein